MEYPIRANSQTAGVQVIEDPHCHMCGARGSDVEIRCTKRLSTNPRKAIDGLIARPGTPKNKLPRVQYYRCKKCFDTNGNPTTFKVIRK